METPDINFFKMPNKIYGSGLTTNEIAVLGYLLSLSNNNKVYPSRKTIGVNTGLSTRTVDKTIKSLKKKGLIEYNRGFCKNGKKFTNEYHVIIKKIAPNCFKDEINNNETDINDIIRSSIENFGCD